MRKSLIILSILLLTSCERWAPLGTGGIAEISNPNAVDLQTQNPNYHMVAKALKTEKARLSALRASGAKYCYPGKYDELQMQSNRAQRELVAGLFIDAHADIRDLHAQITALQCEFKKNPYRQSCAHQARRG